MSEAFKLWLQRQRHVHLHWHESGDLGEYGESREDLEKIIAEIDKILEPKELFPKVHTDHDFDGKTKGEIWKLKKQK